MRCKITIHACSARSASRGGLWTIVPLAVCWAAALAACSARGGGLSSDAQSTTAASGPPEVWGYVLGASDSMPVIGATVWTDPATDNAVTDSTGYWQLTEGITPGRYTVMAEYEGLLGSSAKIEMRIGATTSRVVVLLGSRGMPWPPPIIFDSSAPIVPICKGRGCIGRPNGFEL